MFYSLRTYNTALDQEIIVVPLGVDKILPRTIMSRISQWSQITSERKVDFSLLSLESCAGYDRRGQP
jgi:hypothetical protein